MDELELQAQIVIENYRNNYGFDCGDDPLGYGVFDYCEDTNGNS